MNFASKKGIQAYFLSELGAEAGFGEKKHAAVQKPTGSATLAVISSIIQLSKIIFPSTERGGGG